MRIATWNIERLKHIAQIDKICALLDKTNADILVLTETDTRISLGYRYRFNTPLLAEFESGFYGKTENSVSIYTNYPCVKQIETYDNHTSICLELETKNGNLLIYGTIIGIFGNREKSFQTDLIKQMEDIRKLSANGKNICVLGDYNLSFGDNYYYTKLGRDMVNDTFNNCGIRILTKDRSECIDHIAISESFIHGKDILIDEWNQDKRFSDHKGIVVKIG